MARMDESRQRGKGGNSFSVTVSLTGSIAKVLDEYPDGAQIARELLQNSEDAGSTHQWYLLDHRTHPSQEAYCKGMEDYMGPALLAGNDSFFQEKDFKSLQNFGDSGKKTDYQKIGQMGIGFNSVYHMTDCPSFLSHDQLVILEPHAYILQGGGIREDFVSGREGLDYYADQIEPFTAMNDDLDLSKPYNGTILRLPLRTNAQASTSKLSKKPYPTQKARDMLMMLKEDALECLLFLKHIERISIYERKDNDPAPVLLFDIEIVNAEDIRAERTKFMGRLKRYSDNSSTIHDSELTLDSSIRPKFKLTDEDRNVTFVTWQVTSMLGDMEGTRRQMEEQFNCDTSGHRLIPWVGVAAPVNPAIRVNNPRLFCFLPIGYNTPFPVHINGHFAVKQSRREIWTNQEKDISEQSNAQVKAKWNEYLMTEMVPKVYTRFLENIGLDRGVDYSLWPKPSNDGMLAFFHEVLYRTLTQAIKERRKIFFAGPPTSEKVAALEDCNIADQILGQSTLLVGFLHQILNMVVGLPEHILVSLRTIADNFGLQERILNPSRVRNQLLQSVELFSKISSSATKSQALEYCSRDGDVEALEGLPLLPMADGSWAKFSKETRESCFLVGNLEYEILAFSKTGIIRLNEPAFPYWIIQNPKYGIFLIEGMPPSHFVQKIHGSFATHYRNGTSDFPTNKWLSQLWDYLKTRKSLIPQLEGLSLLRTTRNSLTPLDKANRVVVFDGQGSGRASILKDTLNIMDLQLGRPVLAEGQSGPILLAGDYLVKVTNVSEVFSILSPVPSSNLATLSQDHRKVLSQYVQHHLSPEERLRLDQLASLRKLPIFYGYKGTELESIDQLAIAHGRTLYVCKDFSSSDLPWIPSGMTLFRQRQDLETVLLDVLRIPVMDESQYWIHILLYLQKMPEIEWDKIILAFAPKFQSHPAHLSFLSILQSQEFVCVKGPGEGTQNKRIRPPFVVSSTLEKLYAPDEAFFPVGIYAEAPISTMLQSLGMTSTFNEALAKERILAISDRYGKGLTVADVAAAIFSQMQRYCSEQTLSQDLIDVMQHNRWIPGSRSANSHDISNFRLCSPKECRPTDDKLLVGDTMPAVDITFPSPELRRAFGWDRSPPLDKVLEHLSQLIKAGNEKSDIGRSLEDSLTAIYRDLLERLDDAVALASIKKSVESQKWILVNKKLYSTDRVAFSMPSFLAPSSVQLSSTGLDPLFKALGVQESVEVNDLQGLIHDLTAQYGEETPLSEEDAMLVARILDHIATNPSNSEEQKDLKDLLILTQGSTLCRIDKVVYDDVNASQESSDIWADSEQEPYTMASLKISHDVATRLKITMLSTQYWHAKKDLDFQPFAQEENIVSRIRHILNDYDPSSIFQEFLQNAEDAGATRCIFKLEERSYGTESILCPEMAACQGPALIIYNDAEFTEDDFRALCKLGVGNKGGDSAKIGRHGLGFNSAYHFTDIPSVVSGTHIGFFDPHRAYLPKSRTSKGLVAEGGVRIDFRKLKGPTYADQLAPYKGLFGCDMESHFKGTIFRFPLRTENRPVVPKTESSLGESAWTISRVGNMISGWHQDMKIAMLFLQNLTTIELQGGGDPCKVTKSDRTEKSTLEAFNTRPAIGMTTASLINVQLSFGNSKRSSGQEWLVYQEFQFPISAPISIVKLAKAHRWSPHRGTAFPLRRRDQTAESFKEATQGRLFTHLPTPIRTETKFHLHGGFALLSNRKGLAGGSIITGDPPAEWNEALKKSLMPLHLIKAFAVLLEYIIANSPKETTRDLEVAQEKYFAYLPTLTTLEKVSIMDGAEFWEHTYYYNVFPCRGAGHQLLAKSATGCIFMSARFLLLPQDVQQKVLKMLISSGKHVCLCPAILLAKVKRASISYSEVTSDLVRDYLSRKPDFLLAEIKSAESRTGLLEYLLEDILESDIYPSISRLALIPLVNGEWITPSAEATHYTAKAPMRALVKGNNSLIDEEIFNTITLQNILNKLAKDKRCNIQELELAPAQFTTIFCEENPGPLNNNIVERVWSLLLNYSDLNPFGNLRILKPLWGSLKPLNSVHSGLTLDSEYLPNDIVGLKRVMLDQDVSIFHQSSYYNHSWIPGNRPCHSANILKALHQTQGWEMTFKFTTDEANILREWTSRLNLSAYLCDFLGNFKIWDSYSSDPGAPLISAVGSFFPVGTGKADLSVFGSFPNIINFPGFQDCSDNGILPRLGARSIHVRDILTVHVVPILQFQSGGLTSKQKTTYRNLLMTLCRDGSNKTELVSFFSSQALIPRRIGGGFAKGCDLLRPEDGLLQKFFDDEPGTFPDETVWEGLRQLEGGENFGLQTSDDDPTVRRCAEKLLARIARLPAPQRTLSPTMNASIGSPDLYNLAVELVLHIYARSRYQENSSGLTDWSDRKWAIVPAELATGPIHSLKVPSGLPTFMAFSLLLQGRWWKDETWTVCAFYPASLEPPEHFGKIYPDAKGIANLSHIVSHFRTLITELAPVCKANDRRAMVDLLFQLYQRFEDMMKRPGLSKSLLNRLKTELNDTPFILNGKHLDLSLPASWRKPSQLVLDIEHDIYGQQPVHTDLLQFRTFLVAAGVRKINSVEEDYTVKVSMGRFFGTLERNLVRSFEKQDSVMGFMDVKFIFSDHSNGSELVTKSIYAHKFVLAHTSDHFSTRFTGAWSEFTTNDPLNPGLTVVDMTRAIATEAEYEAFWGVLYYLYTDKLIRTNGRSFSTAVPVITITTTFGGTGTTSPAYEPFRILEPSTGGMDHYHSISAMQAYRNHSVEELRLKDYQLGRRPQEQKQEQEQEGGFDVATGVATGEDKDTAGERVQYLVGLLEVAALYELERLKSLIADALMPPSSLITHGNAFDVRSHARAASQNDLIAYCTAFIRENQELLRDCVRDELLRSKKERAEVLRLLKEDGRRFTYGSDDPEDEESDNSGSEYGDCVEDLEGKVDGEEANDKYDNTEVEKMSDGKEEAEIKGDDTEVKIEDKDDNTEVEEKSDDAEVKVEDDNEDKAEDKDESRGEGATNDVKEDRQPDAGLRKRLDELDCELSNYKVHLEELRGMAA